MKEFNEIIKKIIDLGYEVECKFMSHPDMRSYMVTLINKDGKKYGRGYKVDDEGEYISESGFQVLARSTKETLRLIQEGKV